MILALINFNKNANGQNGQKLAIKKLREGEKEEK